MEGFPHVYHDGKPLPNKGDIPFDSHGRRVVEKGDKGTTGTYTNAAYTVTEGEPEKI